MLSNMSTRSCVYVLLFLVLAVNSDRFGILRNYTLFLYPPVLMRSYTHELLSSTTKCPNIYHRHEQFVGTSC